jgi:hypothetical protein
VLYGVEKMLSTIAKTVKAVEGAEAATQVTKGAAATEVSKATVKEVTFTETFKEVAKNAIINGVVNKALDYVGDQIIDGLIQELEEKIHAKIAEQIGQKVKGTKFLQSYRILMNLDELTGTFYFQDELQKVVQAALKQKSSKASIIFKSVLDKISGSSGGVAVTQAAMVAKVTKYTMQSVEIIQALEAVEDLGDEIATSISSRAVALAKENNLIKSFLRSKGYQNVDQLVAQLQPKSQLSAKSSIHLQIF